MVTITIVLDEDETIPKIGKYVVVPMDVAGRTFRGTVMSVAYLPQDQLPQGVALRPCPVEPKYEWWSEQDRRAAVKAAISGKFGLRKTFVAGARKHGRTYRAALDLLARAKRAVEAAKGGRKSRDYRGLTRRLVLEELGANDSRR